MYSMAIETAFYTNQTNFEFCQLEFFFISTLEDGVGGRGGGEALVEDEWHPPKSSLFQNGLEAKLPPFQWLNSCSLLLRTFCQTFSR